MQGIHLLNHCPEGTGFRVTNEGMGECDVFMAVEDCNNKAWNIVDNW